MPTKRFTILAAMLLSFPICHAQTKVIAHRGYWNCEGSAQNSIASLRKAHEIKAYGSEFDVHLTKDGIAVINHDDTIQGFNIEESTYNQLKDLRLSNGETLATLEQYLAQGKKDKGTQLILELKPHKTKESEDKAVATVLELVKKYKVEKMTEYISFSLDICKALISNAPKSKVAYLRGEIAPKELKEMGFAGLDYHYTIMAKHPEWVKEAHQLGLSVNVWTVNDLSVLKTLVEQGVDFITTDKPVEMIAAVKE